MKIIKKVLGMMQTNCYLLVNEEKGESLLVDPADDFSEIEKMIEESKSRLAGILLTHGHFDHIMALEEVKKRYQVPIYAHSLEKDILENPDFNLSSVFVSPFGASADLYTEDKEKLDLAGFTVEVLHTPGHTKGSVCYYFAKEQVLVSGDTLFACSVGRCDFPTGDGQKLRQSICGLFKNLSPEVKVYPGHMQETDIGYEMRYNPCV